MAKKPITRVDNDFARPAAANPAPPQREDASSLKDLVGGGKARRATPKPPNPPASEPPPSPAAPAPAASATPAAPAPKPAASRRQGTRIEILLDRHDGRLVEDLCYEIEGKFGWRPQRGELISSMCSLMLHASSSLDQMRPVNPTVRPAYGDPIRDHEMKRLAAFVGQMIQASQAMPYPPPPEQDR